MLKVIILMCTLYLYIDTITDILNKKTRLLKQIFRYINIKLKVCFNIQILEERFSGCIFANFPTTILNFDISLHI